MNRICPMNVKRHFLARCIALLSIVAALLIFTIISPGQLSQPLLQITSPPDGTVVSPGQTISVVVTPVPNTSWLGVEVVGEGALGSIWSSATTPPFTFSMRIPAGVTAKGYGLTAFGVLSNGTGAQSPSITLRVKNQLPLIKIRAEISTINFSFVGEQLPLLITGTFTDSS